MRSFATRITSAGPDAVRRILTDAPRLITRSIPDLEPAFDEFGACLEARAEGS